MNEGGYHHNSFFRNLDQYVLAADIPVLRRKLGIVESLSPIGQTILAGNSGPSSPASSAATPSESRTSAAAPSSQ